MAAALLGFSVMVMQSYGDLQRSPIITYNSYPSSSLDVPFPAVSVCRSWIPPNGTRDLIDKLKDNLTTEEDWQDYAAALTLCRVKEEEFKKFRNYSHVWDLFMRLSNMTVEPEMDQDPASLRVYPHKEGFCLAVNMPQQGILTPDIFWGELLLQEEQLLNPAAQVFNLFIQMRNEVTERDESCGTGEEESKYEVYVHGPGDYPGNSLDGGISIKRGSYTMLEWFVEDAVEPLDEVASVPVGRRKCFYPHDAPTLRSFSYYTPRNCLAECRLTEDIKRFGCISHRSPIHPHNAKVCDKYRWYGLPNGVVSGELCDCFQLCGHVVYGLQHLETTDVGDDLDETYVSVSRQIHTYTKKIRSVVMTDAGFVANCAGLLGLFLGVSVLSVFEVLYHVVVRASGATKRDPANDSTSPDLHQLYSTLQQEQQNMKASHQKDVDELRNLVIEVLTKSSRYTDIRLS